MTFPTSVHTHPPLEYNNLVVYLTLEYVKKNDILFYRKKYMSYRRYTALQQRWMRNPSHGFLWGRYNNVDA